MGLQNSYGIKEVADVVFYNINEDGSRGDSVLFTFDSLKVSNIEVSSEDVSARGGKGNPELISWSYGKEITFTIEDALCSLDTLALMFGGIQADNSVTIDASTFGGTYYIEGKTYMRSYTDGKDYLFTFEIPKAKVSTGGTLTMEAEGDPSTFEMTIKALRSTLDGSDTLVIFTKGDEVTGDDSLVVYPTVKITASGSKDVQIPGLAASGYTAAIANNLVSSATIAANKVTIAAGSAAGVDEVTITKTVGDKTIVVAKIKVTIVE